MGVEKSEIIKSTYQKFGQKLEDVESQRKAAMAQCVGSVDILKKLMTLCEAHKKQAYSEEKIDEEKLSLTAVGYIKQGIQEVQNFIAKFIKEREDAYVLYKGQVHALDNVIQMLGKEFELEESKAKRVMEFQDEKIENEGIRKRPARPPGVRPERTVGNPNLGQPKETGPTAEKKVVPEDSTDKKIKDPVKKPGKGRKRAKNK